MLLTFVPLLSLKASHRSLVCVFLYANLKR